MSTDLILPAFNYQTDLFCLYSVSVNKPQDFLLMFPLKSLKMS